MACICGCSKHGATDIKPKAFGFKCDFTVEGSDLSGEMSVNAEGDLSMVFTGPDIINGTGVRVKEDSIIVEVHGISQRYKRSDAPNDSPAILIYDALVEMKSATPVISDGEIKVFSAGNSGEFSATLDGTGHIILFSFAESDTVLHLKNHIDIK